MTATGALAVDLLLTGTVVLRWLNYQFVRLPTSVVLALAALITSHVLLVAASLVPGLGSDLDRLRQAVQSFPDVVLRYVLGFLLFATALQTNIRALRRIRSTVLLLSIGSTLLSTLMVGVLTYYLMSAVYPLDFAQCLLFGAIISPTDAVAVVSVLKEYRSIVPDSTRYFIVGESLFNDAVGVVLYASLVQWILQGGQSAWPQQAALVLHALLRQVFGGVAVGLALGYLTYWMIESLDDPLLEITTSVVLVMNIELVCSRIDASIPLAAVCAGLFIGNYGVEFAMSRKVEKRLMQLWRFIDETLNSTLFLLIGLTSVFLNPANLSWRATLWITLGGIAITVLSRAVSVVLPLAAVVAWERLFPQWPLRHSSVRYRAGTIAVIAWAGLRGGVSIALALAVPGSLDATAVGGSGPSDFGQIIFLLTYACVVWSIVVQGLLFGRFIRVVYRRSRKAAERKAQRKRVRARAPEMEEAQGSLARPPPPPPGALEREAEASESDEQPDTAASDVRAQLSFLQVESGTPRPFTDDDSPMYTPLPIALTAAEANAYGTFGSADADIPTTTDTTLSPPFRAGITPLPARSRTNTLSSDIAPLFDDSAASVGRASAPTCVADRFHKHGGKSALKEKMFADLEPLAPLPSIADMTAAVRDRIQGPLALGRLPRSTSFDGPLRSRREA
ncbi:hypothetical protein CDCA_CDCA17G4360 [Cyanidium caldarium]|uniref:Cation/H+ exchanger transmembrane domain-containing protein n=1 Tax=Cyanidium caldarium TaxID=2771 RepID=A0AAV9J1Y8_CYACA|nr:hypothetical protein CDCA_CDCA17G4360 [Cyanidium caldarium]